MIPTFDPLAVLAAIMFTVLGTILPVFAILAMAKVCCRSRKY